MHCNKHSQELIDNRLISPETAWHKAIQFKSQGLPNEAAKEQQTTAVITLANSKTIDRKIVGWMCTEQVAIDRHSHGQPAKTLSNGKNPT